VLTPQEKFGANVRARRERLGIPQDELAARASLHRTYIGSVERGERNISLANILRLASALKCRPVDLFKNISAGDVHG
jgi:transcriptional regulator with XRE-family HTH domain